MYKYGRTRERFMQDEIEWGKFLVLKMEDLQRFLTDEQKEQLSWIIYSYFEGRLVDDGKGLDSRYYVVNADEPWSDKVKQVILENT